MTVPEAYFGNLVFNDKSSAFSESYLHRLLQRYLPVSEMDLTELKREVSGPMLQSLLIDRIEDSNTEDLVQTFVYEEDGSPDSRMAEWTEFVDDSDRVPTGVRLLCRSISAVNDFEPCQEEPDLPETYSSQSEYFESAFQHFTKEEDVYEWFYGKPSRRLENVAQGAVRARAAPKAETAYRAIDCLISLTNETSMFTDVVGGYITDLGYAVTHPVSVWTDVGEIPYHLAIEQLPLNPRSLLIAGASAGWSNRDIRFRWFGNFWKMIQKRQRGEPTFVKDLGAVLRQTRKHVTDSGLEHCLSSSAIRPLSRATITVAERNQPVDIWPITPFVSFAIGIPDHSQFGSPVKTFRNWSRGKISPSEKTGLELSGHVAKLLLTAPEKRGTNTRHVDFVFRGCPEPRVNLTTGLLDKILNTVVDKTFCEEHTVIILESV